MINLVKKYVAHETLTLMQWLILGVLLLIPFSIRHVFNTSYNFQTGAYSDFTSISLYLSDIFVILAIGLSFLSFKRSFFTTWYIIAIIWLILELFANKNSDLMLQSYFSLRIIALLLFSHVISIAKLNKYLIAWFFTTLGVVQSLISIYQFYFQKSLGLFILGESHLSPELNGVAKLVAHGTKYVRGYGTFPHSNLLAAFLVVAILLNLYLLNKKYQKPTYVVLTITMVINILGLFTTFSRAGIGIAVSAIICYTVILVLTKHFDYVKRLILPLGFSLILSLSLLWPYLSTRATISDSAVKERVFYNKIGLKIIRDNPIVGIGPGVSVLHMEQYSDEQLQPWEIQPIHNYYLITFAEWGIGGILLLGAIIIPIIWLGWLTLKNLDNFWMLTLSAIGLSILGLFLFDHYFYTIWPTQLLLWLIIGLIIREIQQKRIQD